MYSHLFQSLPIGALFFRDPFNELENPSIKIDSNHARKPSGKVVEVNGGVLVFTGAQLISKQPITITSTAQVEA